MKSTDKKHAGAFAVCLAAVMLAGLLTGIPADAAAGTLTVTGAVTSDGGAGQMFPFILTEVDGAGAAVAGGVRVTADIAAGEALSFTLPSLTDGTYSFKIEEDVSKAPDGWTYDKNSYVLTVEVTGGAAAVSGWYTAADFEGSVHAEGETETVTLETEGGGISATGNYHEQGEAGIECYLHASNTTPAAPMHYRHIINDHPSVAGAATAIPVAYCLDYFNTRTETGEGDPGAFTHPYSPSFDWDDFDGRFPDTYEQIIWLVRNGFTSRVEGKVQGEPSWNAFGAPGTDNNLGAIAQIAGMTAEEIPGTQDVTGADERGADGVLSEEEAYSATQLAIWHFTSFVEHPGDGINWRLFGDGGPVPDTTERYITAEFEDVFLAVQALVGAANNAADAAPGAESVITRVSAPVRFDFSAARYTDGVYGPVIPFVEDVYHNLDGADQTVTVTAPVAPGAPLLFADAGATLPLPGSLLKGAGFYAKFSSIPVSDEVFAAANAIVDANSAEMEPVWEMYLMKDQTTGLWNMADNAAQAVMGLGRAFPRISASAGIAGFIESHADTEPVSFANSYTAPEVPEGPGPSVPATGDAGGLLWGAVSAAALLGLLLSGKAARRRGDR